MEQAIKRRKIELMAPAGSFAALTAAIDAGADSVYFGIEQLNMRARSSINFTIDDLHTIAAQCHAADVKTYITLNTILYDHDIALMKTIVKAAKDASIDAIIASDQAAINFADTLGMPVHISTQVNVTNLETVKFYSKFADVMVLSRELSLTQVNEIVKGVEKEDVRGPSGELVRIEIFGHGALCMAVSGKCYLSLHTANSSANRGACIQNCRRTYVVTDKEDGFEFEIDNEFIMSPKDLCTLDFLDQVVDSGITVLKIEGRGRAAEYVKTTIECYSEAIEAYVEGSYTPEKVAAWMERLENVYNRGFWSGYYLGQKMGEWTNQSGSSAKQTKVYLGKVGNYFKNIGVGEFVIESNELNVGEKILIVGDTTGALELNAEEIRVANKPVEYVKKGAVCSIPTTERVRRSDKLYKLVPA